MCWNLLLACMIVCHVKELIPEEEPNVSNDLTLDGEHLSKASLTQPLDYNAPICMIVSSRTWFGWLLHYYLRYSLIVVSCLTFILWFVYALIWMCICYMIFIWLLDAWVIRLVMEYYDDEYGWSHVSATVGVDLRSRAIVMIDLSRWVIEH
jgi:hypothetical protein